jgi:hypothetical protein
MEAQTTSEHVEEGTVSIKENLHPDTESTQNLNQIQPTSQEIKGREPFLLVDDNPINLKVFYDLSSLKPKTCQKPLTFDSYNRYSLRT